MINNPITELEQLTINTASKMFLKETAKWAFFLSIMGFIGIAFIIVLGVFSGVIFKAIPQTGLIPFDLSLVLTVTCLIVAVLYFFPVYYLLRFSNKMKRALASKDDEILADAFEVLKSHYKFIGVFTIITLSLYALLIIVSTLGAIA
jgi:hypothetical protein